MKFIYPAVFRQTENGGYKAWFPDLECCEASGETLEDAIEKVVKKYPHFKNHSGKPDDVDETKGKSWGERQRGGSKKLTGVEAAFLKKNPGLKY